MRVALASIALLAACYRPSGEAACTVACTGPESPCPGAMRCGANLFCEQPGGATCGPGGEVIDAMLHDGPLVDAPDLDGLVAAPCTPAGNMISDLTLSLSGTSFVGDHFSQRAMMFYDNAVLTTEGNFDLAGSSYAAAVTPVMASVTYRDPRLSPGGFEMLLKIENRGSITFGRSTRIGAGKWSLPETLTYLPSLLVFSDADNISPPTLTDPRRIVISSGNGYVELTQTTNGPLSWRVSSTVAGGTLYGVQFLGEASLSPDGLKLIFRGNGGGNISAYYVTRPTVVDSFGGTAVEISHLTSNSVTTPFLSANCKHFYYTASPGGDVRHVTLP